jgi:hypothetical protein
MCQNDDSGAGNGEKEELRRILRFSSGEVRISE